MLWLALVCALLIALNAFFVLMEFALVRVRASRIELLARKGNAAALRVQDMLGRLDDYLAASQVGITVIGLALGWLGEPALAAWMNDRLGRLGLDLPPQAVHILAFGLALAVLAWFHIVLGELVPRAVGIQKADAVSIWGSYPLRLFAAGLKLPILFLSHSSTAILRLMGFKPAASAESAFSEEEMRLILGETQEKGALPLERLFLLENLFDLGATKAGEVMIPRDRVVWLSLKRSWAENLETARSRRLSRYPLCEDGLDSIVGFVHLKDLLLKAEAGQAPDLRVLKRDLPSVGEGEPLEKLLRTFPDKGTHMALVRDAAGRVSGLLTLEDIVEELIGEVHDEFDLPGAWSFMDVVVAEAAAIGLAAESSREAVSLLVERLAAVRPGLDGAAAKAAVLEREQKLSSAVGRGVAVPHARLPGLEKPLVAVGRFAKPVAFQSPDSVPVRLLFLILTPASAPVMQLKVLGRIASLVTNENLRRKLLRVKSAEALVELLRTADTVLAA